MPKCYSAHFCRCKSTTNFSNTQDFFQKNQFVLAQVCVFLQKRLLFARKYCKFFKYTRFLLVRILSGDFVYCVQIVFGHGSAVLPLSFVPVSAAGWLCSVFRASARSPFFVPFFVLCSEHPLGVRSLSCARVFQPRVFSSVH